MNRLDTYAVDTSCGIPVALKVATDAGVSLVYLSCLECLLVCMSSCLVCLSGFSVCLRLARKCPGFSRSWVRVLCTGAATYGNTELHVIDVLDHGL